MDVPSPTYGAWVGSITLLLLKARTRASTNSEQAMSGKSPHGIAASRQPATNEGSEEKQGMFRSSSTRPPKGETL